MSLIRIGISQDKLDSAREEYAAEMRQLIEKQAKTGSFSKAGLAEEILSEAENYSEKEYEAVKKVAIEKGSLSNDDIFAAIGRQYTKAAFIREKLVKEGVISK